MLLMGTAAREMTIAEVAAATGWNKSSVHKILVTLNYHGFLERNEATKKYSLGVALVRCGQAVLNNLHVNHSAKSFLKELSDFSGETANLAVLYGSKMVIVDVVESPVQLRVSPPIGTTAPLTAKSNGKAVLAWLPESEVDKIIQTDGLPAWTKNSIVKMKLYQNDLAEIRKQGYATDFEEFQEGINAVSAPVFNSQGQVVATLSVVGPAFRMTKEKMRLYGEKCAKAAAQLSPMIR
jgi:IclR family acetate operon transcriptional repressor